jgi:Helix-turn-helix of DDE superfamily endonuclease
MLEYSTLKTDRHKFLALTGLTLKEFKALLLSFTERYRRQYAGHKTLAGRKRKRQVGGGRRGMLVTSEQTLLFIFVYLKAYPLQVVMGELFGLSQAAANQWVHRGCNQKWGGTGYWLRMSLTLLLPVCFPFSICSAHAQGQHLVSILFTPPRSAFLQASLHDAAMRAFNLS